MPTPVMKSCSAKTVLGASTQPGLGPEAMEAMPPPQPVATQAAHDIVDVNVSKRAMRLMV
jgi:hypothetical protein